MQSKPIVAFSFYLFILFFFPLPTHAFWGAGSNASPSLDLESGYDINTVITVTGRVVALQSNGDRSNLHLEIKTGETRMIVILGPQEYWNEQGLPLKTGNEVMVRGSKAQAQDGVWYILARDITDINRGIAVILRDESGQPNWNQWKMRSGEETGSSSNGENGRGTGKGGGQSGSSGSGGGSGGGGGGGGGK